MNIENINAMKKYLIRAPYQKTAAYYTETEARHILGDAVFEMNIRWSNNKISALKEAEIGLIDALNNLPISESSRFITKKLRIVQKELGRL